MLCDRNVSLRIISRKDDDDDDDSLDVEWQVKSITSKVI